ncbi:hypothetical protein ACKWTF_000730 [Chironomus riparius]
MSDNEMEVEQSPNPFNRKARGKLDRTPPKNIIKSPHESSTRSIKVGVKRHSEELLTESNENMLDKLMNRFNVLSNDLKTMENNVEKKLDEKFDGLQIFIDKTEERLGKIEGKVKMYDVQVEQNSKAINQLNQKELQNKIDIMGAVWPDSLEKDKIKEEIIKLMEKYNIKIEMSKIKAAYVRKIKSLNVKVMVVEFTDFETKLNVLKQKRQSKIKDGIYFDNSLTPINGKFISSARKVAKEKNFKTYLNNNRICVRKSDDMVKYIESDADLEEVKTWDANIDPKNKKNERNQAASSSATSNIKKA